MSTWYHGSPLELSELLAGSTITPDRDLARVFSHKPLLVSLEDQDGRILSIRHDGSLPGYLYGIDEEVGPEDVLPHPNSSMPAGLEWLTQRPLRLRLLEPTSPRPEETFSEQEKKDLYERIRNRPV